MLWLFDSNIMKERQVDSNHKSVALVRKSASFSLIWGEMFHDSSMRVPLETP